jgi:hypothetical protein
MYGVRKPVWTPGQTEVCPHTAAITHSRPADKLAAIMRLLTLEDHKLPGFSHPITDFFSDNKRLERPLPTANLKNLWDFSAHSERL